MLKQALQKGSRLSLDTSSYLAACAVGAVQQRKAYEHKRSADKVNRLSLLAVRHFGPLQLGLIAYKFFGFASWAWYAILYLWTDTGTDKVTQVTLPSLRY